MLASVGVDAPRREVPSTCGPPHPEATPGRSPGCLATEGGVLVSPGEFYGEAGAGNIRVAVVQPDERLALVGERLAALRGSRA